MSGEVSRIPACKTAYSSMDLPEGLVKVKVRGVVDGDTVKIPWDGVNCGQNECSVRLAGHNSTEKTRKEKWSIEARNHLSEEVEGKEVLVKLEEQTDHYGRLLARRMFLPVKVSGKTFYYDIYAEIIQAGLAHVYAVSPNEWARREELLACQQEAKKAERGIWEKTEDSRFSGDLHVTSFHANGIPFPGLNCRGANEPPNCEYFRMAVISDAPINLGNYSVENCDPKPGELPKGLPSATIPPGVTIKVYSGKGENKLDPKKDEIVVFLGREKQFWDDNGATVIIRHKKTGVIQDKASSRIGIECRPK